MNAAFDLLTQGLPVPRAAVALTEKFGLSLRQSHRYLQEAQRISCQVPVPSPIVPVTIKMPGDVAQRLRQYAQGHGTTIGDVVSRAVLALLDRDNPHG